jgi:hypothetical protein
VTNVTQYGTGRCARAEPAAASVRPSLESYKSAMRADIALLASALFLQRFSLPFSNSTLGIDFIVAALIFAHQFASGRLYIQYDRLLLFLVLFVAATSSLVLNSDSKTSSYGLFVVIYFLFTLSRPSCPEQYKSTLHGFQYLVLILSWLALAQVLAQFVVSPRSLVMFFGVIPDSLLGFPGESVAIGQKTNGIFLSEASTMSQTAALAILIEILEFRRPRYLIVLALAFLLAYSGTGLSILLLCLPLAALTNRRAQLPAMVVTLFALGLFATGFIHLSSFSSRVGEFQDPHASGFMRFVSSFWMAADYFDTASLQELLLGNGPGYGYVPSAFYATSSNSWFKLILEYGAFGAFVFTCFFGFCFRRSRCPKPLLVALIYNFLFTSSNLVGTSTSVMMVVLCTLSGSEPRRVRSNERDPKPSSLVTGSTAV